MPHEPCSRVTDADAADAADDAAADADVACVANLLKHANCCLHEMMEMVGYCPGQYTQLYTTHYYRVVTDTVLHFPTLWNLFSRALIHCLGCELIGLIFNPIQSAALSCIDDIKLIGIVQLSWVSIIGIRVNAMW